jgi:hypothetical protein
MADLAIKSLAPSKDDHIPNSDPPRIVIKSVDPEFPTYERDAEEVNMIGRVIWATRRI